MILSGRDLIHNSKQTRLTHIQARLLHELILAKGNPVSFEELSVGVWQEVWTGDKNKLNVTISSLRDKLESVNLSRSVIESVKNFGYRLKEKGSNL